MPGASFPYRVARKARASFISAYLEWRNVSLGYMNAGMRVANLINFSCTSLRLDLYSFCPTDSRQVVST